MFTMPGTEAWKSVSMDTNQKRSVMIRLYLHSFISHFHIFFLTRHHFVFFHHRPHFLHDNQLDLRVRKNLWVTGTFLPPRDVGQKLFYSFEMLFLR